tara:strand:- start:1413 stop:1742 length:330 start_codon:yes stop_codon:yes gene_type:complete
MSTENEQGNDDSNAESKWRSRELGALWKRQGRNQNYLTGKLKIGEFGVEKEVQVVIFTNKNKDKNERAPDFIVYESEPAPESSGSEARTTQASAPADTVVDEEVPELLA